MSTQDFATNEQAWTAAADWAREDRMNELETLMWRSERHPALSSTITALLVLDQAPEWDRLYAAHEWATKLVRRCRQRVLEPALPVGPPAWVPDHDFHLDYHLRRTRLPRPGTMAQLLNLVQANAMAPFDRTRPLWEGLLIEGLEGDRAAYLLKLHHSLTDGMGGLQLLSLVQSRTREHTPDKPVATITPAEREPDPFALAVDELTEQMRNVPRLMRRLGSVGRQALSHPGETASGAVRFAGSLRRTLTPPPADRKSTR